MPFSDSAAGLEAGFERELTVDRALRTRIEIGSWIVALTTVAILITLIIPLHRTSPWLVAMSLYAIATRVGAFVAWKAFLVPRFLVHLDDPDSSVAAAARAVFERHRAEIVEPILVDRLESHDPAAIAALRYEHAAQIAREYDIEARRRLGRRYFVAWCLASAVIWTTLVVTRGGPTD